jgi:hypothetical protein
MAMNSAFDAAAWMGEFQTVGGTFAIWPGGDLLIGWTLKPHLNAADARALFNQVKDRPDRLETVKMAVEQWLAR